MLADAGDHQLTFGALDADLHLPDDWLNTLLAFLRPSLASWRDDAARPSETGETRLTAQLCAHLNSACRRSNWDYLQFIREQPDEVRRERALDLIVAPSGATIWLEGLRHSHYDTLLPIECKRLPTPSGRDRDPREYVYSQFSSTGGLHRFKQGLHAAAHRRAVMIGYIQTDDVAHWCRQVGDWLTALANDLPDAWSLEDGIQLVTYDPVDRSAALRSRHARRAPLEPITVDHLWIEM